MEPMQIGVCTWSLAMDNLGDALRTVRETLGLGVIHLGFWDDRFKDVDRVMEQVRAYNLEVSATCLGFEGEDYGSIQKIAETGGFRPDGEWERRFAKVKAFAAFTETIGVKLLSTHIGFVPHEANDPQYKVMVERLKQVCDVLGEKGLTLVMETGQEKAESLMGFIDAVGHDNIGVNFDPANMILYGVGEPVEAVGILKDKIIHCHMKDANWSSRPMEEWGEEVVLGSGEADIPRVVSKLRSTGYTGPLIIEREAGSQRVADIREGIELLESLVG